MYMYIVYYWEFAHTVIIIIIIISTVITCACSLYGIFQLIYTPSVIDYYMKKSSSRENFHGLLLLHDWLMYGYHGSFSFDVFSVLLLYICVFMFLILPMCTA